MKLPQYVLDAPSDCIRVGLNGFAVQLIAESFADDPAKFGDENVLLCARAHNGHEVWMVVTKTRPKREDFEPRPAAATPNSVRSGVEPLDVPGGSK